MDEKGNITIPFEMFMNGVNAITTLKAISAMIIEGKEFCSKPIKLMLGIDLED